jgi:hypothetical protein
MRFAVTRLCGGEAIMTANVEVQDLDMDKAEKAMQSMGAVTKQKDPMMLVVAWNGMDVTIYPQGKVMFFKLKDKETAIEYATKIIEAIQAA